MIPSAALAGIAYLLALTVAANLQRNHMTSGFGFWNEPAGFDISQSLIEYNSSTSTYGRAFWVGLTNTLLVACIGIVLATVVGFVIGIAQLSSNWLVARLAAGYVQLVRNVPLEEYRFSSAMARRPVKVTVLSPDRISQRFDWQQSKSVYPNMDAFLADVVAITRQIIRQLVDAGCRYIQIDAPGYTAYADKVSLERMRSRGEDPDENMARSIAAVRATAPRSWRGWAATARTCSGARTGSPSPTTWRRTS